jgi:hypothetical protein
LRTRVAAAIAVAANIITNMKKVNAIAMKAMNMAMLIVTTPKQVRGRLKNRW